MVSSVCTWDLVHTQTQQSKNTYAGRRLQEAIPDLLLFFCLPSCEAACGEASGHPGVSVATVAAVLAVGTPSAAGMAG